MKRYPRAPLQQGELGPALPPDNPFRKSVNHGPGVQEVRQECQLLHARPEAILGHPANIAKSLSYATLRISARVMQVTARTCRSADEKAQLSHTDTESGQG